jgi:MFS family permease
MAIQTTGDDAGARDQQIPLEHSSGGYRYLVLGLLTVVYTLNFLDRQLLAILAEPIRGELGLTDTQLGLLSGVTFAAFYTVLGIPLAWVADRANRVRMIAIACTVWSLFSAACGLAGSFAQLALARIGVGVGEAGGTPPAHSLISDYFPPRERTTAMAIYGLGVAAGPSLGIALGGAIAATYGWRMAFIAIGLPGVLVSLAVLMLIREPRAAKSRPPITTPPLLETIRLFAANPTLAWTACTAALSAFVGYGSSSWTAAFLMRERGMSLAEGAAYFSLTSGVAAVSGMFLSGWLVDRWAKRSPRAYALVPGLAFLLAAPCLLAAVWAPDWRWSLLFLFPASLCLNTFLAPAVTIVQNAVAPERRAASSAILLFTLNLIGLGGGPVYVGMISDHQGSLAIGMIALVPVTLLTVLAQYMASRTFRPVAASG